jgi:hypothetical protein
LTSSSNFQEFADTDKVLLGFFTGCMAAPDACSLAKLNMTANELQERLYALLEDVKYNPVPLNGALINYQSLKTVIFASLYYPSRWPTLATALYGLLSGNASAMLPYISPDTDGLDKSRDALLCIRCSDNTLRLSKKEELLPAVQTLYSGSRIGGDVLQLILAACAQWKFQAHGPYTGDFRARTRRPLLLVGNSFDPVTPLQSAYNMSSGFEGSVVLQHDGYGVSEALSLEENCKLTPYTPSSAYISRTTILMYIKCYQQLFH